MAPVFPMFSNRTAATAHVSYTKQIFVCTDGAVLLYKVLYFIIVTCPLWATNKLTDTRGSMNVHVGLLLLSGITNDETQIP